jgi:hypothetical protein
MQLPTILMLAITIAIGLVGLLFLLFPDSIQRLEARLNAPWGDQEVTALRLGLRGEQAIEQTINRNVLEKQLSWDGWAKKHPRVVGIALCLVSAGIWWQL